MILVVQPWSTWSTSLPLGQCHTSRPSSRPIGVVLSALAASSLGLPKVARRARATTWRIGSSRLATVEAAVEEAVCEWQNSEMAGRESNPSKSQIVGNGSDQTLAFGLLFLPSKWAAEMKNVLTDLRSLGKFPEKAPLLGIPTQGETLSIGSAQQDPQAPLPRAVILEEKSLELISHESIRIQDSIDANPMKSIQAVECE